MFSIFHSSPRWLSWLLERRNDSAGFGQHVASAAKVLDKLTWPLDLLGSLMSGISSGAHLAITHLNKSHDVVDCLVLDVLLQKLDPIYIAGSL